MSVFYIPVISDALTETSLIIDQYNSIMKELFYRRLSLHLHYNLYFSSIIIFITDAATFSKKTALANNIAPLVLHFGSKKGLFCMIILKIKTMFGVVIFLVICLNVVSTICGGNDRWGE